MTEATLVRWLVPAGQRVEQKQSLAEIETEKIVSDLESPARGVLAHCTVGPGDVAAVAQTIAWILVDGESTDDVPNLVNNTDGRELPTLDVPVPAPASPAVQAKAQSNSQVSSPAVRRLARELNVDLAVVIGTGPEGRIIKEDVVKAAAQKSEANEEESVLIPLSATRRAIVATVTKSIAIPQIVLHASADASALVAMRQQNQAITYNDILIALVAKTLQHHKFLNASYEDAGIRLHAKANIGLAVAVEEGLLIPVIQGADRLSLGQISNQRQRLVELVRTKKITLQQLRGGTFTISNLGMFPVDSFTALIQPPQAAILSVGRIQQTATRIDRGGLVFRPRMTLGLTLDHRVADGAVGAAFLQELITQIENPPQEQI